ncbi:protein Hook homolog 2-like isoform X1 [Rhinichthys klamathensis goyatoka]|uniref:protein Hook homolog 2-like isoform X1 n=1 Tax=Rhinichthys klamathensis goyatoka TaxID=3034132 RepID=UPI0024B5D0E2|nr:protein Hook homolog 2-like isoform X1 [Rhinichthys klamathensis goyatoka]
MSLNKHQLSDSLFIWLQTFQVPSCASKHELTSGVAIAHVLNKIDPSWFNETWLSRIKEEGGTNWRLKVLYSSFTLCLCSDSIYTVCSCVSVNVCVCARQVSNLKKILQSMMEYYHDVLSQQVSEEHVPDVCLIGEMGDVTELGRLLQLVLGCAVSCDHKQEHIQQIMTLEESVQHVVMAAIQELLTKEPVQGPTPESYGDFDSQSRKYYFLSEETDDTSQRCRELQQQLSVLTEEKSSLQLEVQSLRERLTHCEPTDVSSTITNKKLLLLQSQMEQLQEENYRLESGRDDQRVRADVLEREVTDLQLRNEELTSLAQEAQSLKDEMDILRHSSDRVSRLEAMVDTYKRKLEDLGDLRRQVRLLEERNHVYMQRTCELEEEQRRANTIRSQLDSYKRQAHEMSAKHSAEAMKAERWQFEYKNLNDKYETLLKEREKLISERDTLRDTTDELRCAQVQQQCLTDSLSGDSGAFGSLASEIMPTEFRDTVVRLQQENKMLCVQEESYRHRLEELQTQLEESQRCQNTLETHNRLSQQQISELVSQIEELQRALQEQDSKTEDSSLLKKKLEEHLEKLHEAHTDLQKKREVIDDLEPPADSNMAKKVDELQEILKKKDEDMRRMEERYKRYVDKARTVIKTLDPKKKSNTVPVEVQALKNQLTEKDRRIQHMEHDFEKSRSRHDQEEKLIISAWYNMGMALHQKVAGERSGSGSAQSFLAQQRQSTHARRGLARLQPR